MALPQIRLFLQLFIILVLPHASLAEAEPSPYLSPSTFFREFPRMLRSLRIFAYRGQAGNSSRFHPSSSAALFHDSLLRSPFLTHEPEDAHLFYLSFSGKSSPRSISRFIRSVRSELPFWNRTLGADHFYVSEDGVGDSSDRNLVELRKNAIQISPFPAVPGRFIPHKDLTLPYPIHHDSPTHIAESFKFLAFHEGEATDPKVSTVLADLRRDPEILIESRSLDPTERAQSMSASRFCLFFYGVEADPPLGETLASGCVPVVVSGRPILDLPFGDVLRWSEIAMFVGLHGGAREVRRAMERACGDRYGRMREMAVEASAHFRWRQTPPRDAFRTVLYQLWLRRHTIRYARRDESKVATSAG